MLQPNDPEDYIPILIAIFVMLLLLGIALSLVSLGALAHQVTAENHVGFLVLTSAESLVVKDLKLEEGFRSKVYRDQKGHATIGYGHNLEGREFHPIEEQWLFPGINPVPQGIAAYIAYWEKYPMSKETAELILDQDITIAEQIVKHIYDAQWESIDDVRQSALIDLAFNLGENRYKKFKRHIKATKLGDWERSAAEILNSLAAKQDRNRYKDIARRLKDGDVE